MNNMLLQSLFFGMFLSLAAYEFGLFVKKKLKLAVFNPLLIAIVLIIPLLLLLHVDYETYYAGAKYLAYLLTPATVCLAVPLYEQFELLKCYPKAVVAGIMSGVLTSAVCILGLCLLFGFDHNEYVTMLPKSITTAIGMGVSEELGGIVNITVAAIVITGVLGNIIAPLILRVLKITEPVAKGVAIGTASHAIGTVRAIEMGEIEGAMSSLSLAVAGLITVFSSALFANFM